jgi:hypothetical protein
MNYEFTEYIGVSNIQATPMDRAAYNHYRGGSLPEDENGSDMGYLIKKPHKAGEHISWLPSEVFYQEYTPITSLDFSSALYYIKQGKKVARKGWNGKDMFIFLVPGSSFKVNRKPLLGIYKLNHPIEYQPHIDMKTADGSIVPWLASQSDLLADDWMIIN